MQERRLLLGITGGIAAYKAPFIIRLLQQNNVLVRTVVTEHALKFVTETTLESLTGFPVAMGLFEKKEHNYEHIELAKWADVFVVAPATANAMAKFAGGVADDLLSTLFVAMKCPTVIAPAMNEAMFADVTVSSSLKKLRENGCVICGPDAGYLACGDYGAGRMAAPEEIAEAALLCFKTRTLLDGKKVLVTAGATREHIDPVRFITNRSSGKMGYAVAAAFAAAGADVTLVSGPTSLYPPYGVKLVKVGTAAQMYDTVMSMADSMSVIVKAAAVADYTPEKVADQKLKKSSGDMTLTLVRTKDILAELGTRKSKNQILVGFSAETENFVENAAKKLVRKNLDMIVLNDVSSTDAGFETDNNRVVFIRPAEKAKGDERSMVKEVDGRKLLIQATKLMSKNRVAAELVVKVLEML